MHIFTRRYGHQRFRLERSGSRWGLAGLIVVLVVYFHLSFGNFATVGNGLNILTNAVPLLIAALPAARLIIAGSLDLSIAGSYALLSVVCGGILNATGSVVSAIVGALLVGAVLGVLNGLLVNFLKISPIIVTIGLGGVYTGMALISTNGGSQFDFPLLFNAISQSKIWGLPTSLIIAVLFFSVGTWFLTRTVSGVHSYAIGGNPRAARLAGIQVDRHMIFLFVAMQVSMAVTAIITASQAGTATPQTGMGFEIAILTVVMLGGVTFTGGAGRPLGILFGVVVINVLQAGFVFAGMSSYVQQVAQGALLVIALTVDQIIARRRPRSRPRAETVGQIAPEDGLSSRARSTAAEREIGAVVLENRGLTKAYGSIAAVNNVSFSLRQGEILCLVGDNGAGKSTVIKMLSGVELPDSGTIMISAERVRLNDPAEALEAGIETVHQESALSPNLGVALNITLGREPSLHGIRFPKVLDRQAAVDIATTRVERLDISRITDYMRPIVTLSGGQQQSVAIARAVQKDTKVIILDEPTTALGVRQTANLLNLIRQLAGQGIGVLLVTHDVQVVLEIADRIVVLARGAVSFTGRAAAVTEPQLIHLMAGYQLEEP